MFVSSTVQDWPRATRHQYRPPLIRRSLLTFRPYPHHRADFPWEMWHLCRIARHLLLPRSGRPQQYSSATQPFSFTLSACCRCRCGRPPNNPGVIVPSSDRIPEPHISSSIRLSRRLQGHHMKDGKYPAWARASSKNNTPNNRLRSTTTHSFHACTCCEYIISY
mgnify:CR=1 FL=1